MIACSPARSPTTCDLPARTPPTPTCWPRWTRSGCAAGPKGSLKGSPRQSTAIDTSPNGERQLIALGQIVLLDPSVVILDEPTSALDPATSRALERATTRALAGRTIILVTHRLASAATCDEIIVLEGGQVSERGHTTLLAGAGLYARLWAAAGHPHGQAHE